MKTMAPQTAFGHPNCYARDLGGCSVELSGEHYVSDSVLRRVSQGEPSVLVRNLTFQEPGKQESKGIESLVARVLCKTHNERLSSFDTAGCTLFDGMDQIDSAAGNPNILPVTITVSGDKLERWMLKMLCAGLFSGNFSVGDGNLKSSSPPKEWIDILFGGRELPDGQGLYARAGIPGIEFRTDPSVLKLQVERDATAVVIGLTVWIFNFEFTLVLAQPLEQRESGLEGAVYRPNGIVVLGSNKKIQMTWADGYVRDNLYVQWIGAA